MIAEDHKKSRFLTQQDVLQKLHVYYVEHAKEYNITKLGIFGSYARNENTAGSDVDIVFESPAPNLLTTSRMKQELEELFELPVDIVRKRPAMKESLRKRIETDALYV